MDDLRILYEDKFLVLCVKPVGVLSEDSDAAACMPALLRRHYRALGQNDYIATVHRLDKAVGGVMLFSRRRDVTGKLTAAVAEHRVTKEYLAVLRGTPEKDADTLTDLLFRDATHNKSYVVTRMRKGVREARLDYTALAHHDGLTLVRVRLHTGRTHQIRVQFSHRGLPLLGDVRYGSKAPCSPALWSFRLALTHPVTGQPLDVTCPPPAADPRTDVSPGKKWFHWKYNTGIKKAPFRVLFLIPFCRPAARRCAQTAAPAGRTPSGYPPHTARTALRPAPDSSETGTDTALR